MNRAAAVVVAVVVFLIVALVIGVFLWRAVKDWAEGQSPAGRVSAFAVKPGWGVR